MIDFRTDLADERRDIYKKANKLENEIPGIESEEVIDGDIKINKVKVLDSNGAQAIGKPVGNYITLDIKNLKIASETEIEKAAVALSKELKQLIDIHIQNQDDILVVGLRKFFCYSRCTWT